MSKHISSETIYEYVYVRARGTLRDDLIAFTPTPTKTPGTTAQKGCIARKTAWNILLKSTNVQKEYSQGACVGKDHKSALISLVE